MMSEDEWKAGIAAIAAVMNKHFYSKEFILYGGGIPGEGPHWKLSKYYDAGGWKLEFDPRDRGTKAYRGLLRGPGSNQTSPRGLRLATNREGLIIMTSVMPTGDKQTKAATPAQIKAAEKRLTKARSVLAMDPQWSLFSALIFGMECKVSEMVPTAGTNGKTVWYNPHFIESLTDSQVRFLVLHETLHPALDHTLPSRFKDKNLMIWNAAADYVINYAACENGSEFTPKTIEAMDGLYDAKLYTENDGNADKIYKVLAEEQANQLEPDGRPRRIGGGGGSGNDDPSKGKRKGKPIDDTYCGAYQRG